MVILDLADKDVFRQPETIMAQLEAEKERTRFAQEAQAYTQNIIDTGREPFLVLDNALVVRSANRAFYQTFQVSRADTEGCLIYELGNRQWDIPALRTLLEEILPQNSTFDDFEVSHDFPGIGSRLMLLNARKIYRPGNNSQLILLAIEDVTKQRAAEKQIADTHGELQVAHEQLQADYQRERRIAQALQRPLMLETPEDAFPDLSVATLYSSSWKESEVGGDFYDAVPLADKRVALLVGDASGKGITAAARATEVKDVLRAFLRVYPYYPAVTVSRLNDYLCDVQSLDHRAEDTFVALSMAVINAQRSEAVLTWAGIEPPIIVRANGTIESMTGGGLPLGASAQEVYVESTVPFQSGDTILLWTDGLSEARRGKEFLGTEGVEEIVRQSQSAPTLKEVGQQILAHAREFAGGHLQDDACLVLVRRR